MAVEVLGYPDAFKCGTCDCNADHQQPWEKWVVKDVLGEDFKSKTCLRFLISDNTEAVWDLYHHYQNGNLLWAGGLYDQPALYLEAMQLIDARINRIRAEKAGK